MSRRTLKWTKIIRQSGTRDKALGAVVCTRRNKGKVIFGKASRYLALVDKLFPKSR